MEATPQMYRADIARTKEAIATLEGGPMTAASGLRSHAEPAHMTTSIRSPLASRLSPPQSTL